MYNLVSKTFATFFDPLAVTLVLMLLGLALGKWRAWSRRTLWIAAGFLFVAGSEASQAVLARVERQYPDVPIADQPNTQTIVLLGGAIMRPGGIHRHSGLIDSSDRILHAFRLFKAGKAPMIFIAGGNNPLEGGRRAPEAALIADLLREWGVPQEAIEFEGASINTHENAQNAWAALHPRGIGRILLVTSASHMPRAAATFRKAGFDVVPAPADFITGWAAGIAWLEPAPKVIRAQHGFLALQEMFGLLVYQLRGWA